MTTTLTCPGRTAVATLTAAVRDFLGDRFAREPEHLGATEDWHPLADLSGRPVIGAIAAAPHREVVDEHLGVLRIASLEPARLFNALASAVAR
ncbi:hypothetical protein GA0070622_0922 [Micromonospora sediminicola]|uniref:Uncharacterized protein n=1 Tax=Micromonospora sediminicola TaxID=946078 RepID=A0A1A9B4K2_9ACTN|nr:hypothetical protein [Micromonospora sediminicola]SBT63954.1 hypothetical protein GA0070622_0922 [Micromonospora sediminicola]